MRCNGILTSIAQQFLGPPKKRKDSPDWTQKSQYLSLEINLVHFCIPKTNSQGLVPLSGMDKIC